MTSLRNNVSTEDRLLEAARDCILAVGWKRTTLTDVARKAGVSRMTVYRTYPDMTSLFGDLMTREWVSLLTGVMAEESDQPPWPTRIANEVVHSVAALRLNPLFHRIVDVDPELLLPYLLQRRGRSQQAVIDLLVEGIAQGQAEGGLRAGDPQLLARTLVLTAQGFVISPQTMVDGEVTGAELDAELATLVERYLA
jgi:AcrR family transcriptional regulator